MLKTYQDSISAKWTYFAFLTLNTATILENDQHIEETKLLAQIKGFQIENLHSVRGAIGLSRLLMYYFENGDPYDLSDAKKQYLLLAVQIQKEILDGNGSLPFLWDI